MSLPDITAKLGLKKPLGTETVTRQSFNDNWDLIDQNAASQSQVDEPFYLKGAVYDSGNNRIVCTFGKGQANFAGTLVAKSADFIHYITGPVVNTSYYLYMKNDGTIAQNTTGAKVDSAVQIWKVTTGASVNTITTTDLRGRLAGASAAIVQKALDDHAAATDPHSQYATDTDLATHAAANGGVHGITGTIESVAGAQAKVDAVQTNLDTHKSAAMLDHPDNSVTDTKIGNRTINQALSSPSNTGTLTSLLSWLAGRIKGIMGTTNWFDTPPTTLTNVKTHIDAAAPHSGHETPTGSQSKVDAHSSTKTGVHGAEAGYLAKTGRSDQLVSFNDLADKPSTYPAAPHDHDDRYYTEIELGATTDGASGADKIGSTAISGVTGATVQAQLESVKTLLDGKAATNHGNHVPTTQTANDAVYLRNDNSWQTITPAKIGAAPASHTTSADHDSRYYTETESDARFAPISHGNHVPTTQTANNAVFLRNDNTWQTVAPANIGALPSSHASSADHDGRYYTETEADSRFSPISHGNHVPTTQAANNAVFLRNDNTWQTVTPENIGAAASGHNHDAVYATIGHTHADATDVASGFMSAAEHTKLAGIASGAEVNQNAFSNVKVNGTTIAADSETDTLELVAGTGMALTPDAANDKVTFAVNMSDSLHGNRGGGALHENATTTTNGFMSAGDKVIQGAMQDFIENGFSPFVTGCQVCGGVEVIHCSDPRITYKGTYILETFYQGKSSDGTLMNIPNDVNNELNLPFIGTGIIFVTFADMYNRSWYYSIDDGPITKLDVPISTPAMHRVKTPIVSGLSYGSHNLRMYPSGIDRPEPRYVDSFEIVQTIDKSINIDAGIQYTASKNATVNAITITHSEPTAGQKGRCDAVVVNADGITSIITGTDGLSELGYRVEQTGRISRRYRNRKEINENLVKVWTNLTDAVERVYGTSDGYQWASLTTSDTICIGFFGTGLDVICETGPSNGILGIKVDAGSETTIDLYSATTIQQVRKNVLTGQALGWHTVTLRVTGTKNASASSAWIKIDAFDIYMPKTPDIPAGSQVLSYDTISPLFVSMSFPTRPTSDQEGGWVRYDDDVSVKYTGTWYDYWTPSDYGGVEKYSPNAGATAEFASVGTCFRVIGPIGNAGQAEILFDGVSQGTYNWYSATVKEQMVIWQSAIVPLGVHTVTVRVLGTHTGGTSNNVDIDAFEVYRPLYVQDVRNLNPVKESTLEDLQYTPPTGMNKDLYLFDAKSALDAALTMDGVEYGENAKGIYWRFPNGLAFAVINSVSGASSSATQTMGLYLPIPMLDGYRPFVDLEGVSSAGNGFVTTWAYQNFTPTSFTIAHSSYISQTIQIRAFVIGRWK